MEATILLIAAASISTNVLYLHLITGLGSVFTSQSAYFITLAGIGWSVLLLGESLNAWIWAALGLTAALTHTDWQLESVENLEDVERRKPLCLAIQPKLRRRR